MTRREFIKKVIKAGLVIIIAGWAFAKRASPRKFVRAGRLKKYPGRLRPLGRVDKQSKWSG